MSIKFSLYPNLMTPDPNDHSARVTTNATLNEDDVIRLCLQRGTTLTEPDLRAVFTLFSTVVTDEVANGNAVTLPLVNIRPSITGVFTSATDSFDPSRHIKRASLSSGNLLYEKMLNAKAEKVASSLPWPELVEFTDVKTRTTNTILTPGNIGQVVGSELKFDVENADEGVFFISTATGTETKVDVIASRTEGKLVFHVPAGLTAGDYRLEVRKGYGNAATIRSGALSEALQVV